VYPLTPDAPVCELFSVDMGVCGGAHARESAGKWSRLQEFAPHHQQESCSGARKEKVPAPCSGHGQAWLQQVQAAEAVESIPHVPLNSC
jgi:hypothetical protein